MEDRLEMRVQLIGLIVNVIGEATPDKLQPSWVQTYGQLIGVVIGATLAGAVAVALAIMNNRGSDVRLKMQQDHELAREQQRVSRDRLEELYVLAGHWTTLLEQNAILGLRLAKGLLTYGQYVDAQISATTNAKVEASRMNLLMGVYASEGVNAAYNAVKEANGAFLRKAHIVELLAQRERTSASDFIRTPKADEKLNSMLDELAGNIAAKARTLLGAIAAEAAK